MVGQGHVVRGGAVLVLHAPILLWLMTPSVQPGAVARPEPRGITWLTLPSPAAAKPPGAALPAPSVPAAPPPEAVVAAVAAPASVLVDPGAALLAPWTTFTNTTVAMPQPAGPGAHLVEAVRAAIAPHLADLGPSATIQLALKLDASGMVEDVAIVASSVPIALERLRPALIGLRLSALDASGDWVLLPLIRLGSQEMRPAPD